jgi:hypothetical protein
VERSVGQPGDDLLVAEVRLGAPQEVGSVSWKSIIRPFTSLPPGDKPCAASSSSGRDVAVALDVAALAADDEETRSSSVSVRDCARRRRLDVHEPALGDLVHPRLSIVEARRAAVDEVELVLLIVVVLRPSTSGG